KPIDRKKRGYTRMHLIQLVFLCYMRPILTTDEIKKVFALAFNEINQPEDDIITWEEAYRVFLLIYRSASEASDIPLEGGDQQIERYLDELEIKDSFDQIRMFIQVLILVTRAT